MAKRELKVSAVSVIGHEISSYDVLTLDCLVPTADVMSADATSVIAHSAGSKENGLVLGTFTLPASDDVTYTFEVKTTDATKYTGTGSGGALVGTLEVKREVLVEHAKLMEKLSAQGAFAGGKRVLLQMPLTPKITLAFDVELGDKAKGSTQRGDMAEGAVRECNVFLSAVGILATRGESTDSFARVMMVSSHEAEFEMGRTNTINDDLSPQYRKYVRVRYSQAALSKDCSIRIEICDPGTPSLATEETFTVVGACQLPLATLHALVEAPAGDDSVDLGEGLLSSGTAPPGSALLALELRQKAELQKIVPPRLPKKHQKEREDLLSQKRAALLKEGSLEAECMAMAKKRRKKPKKDEDKNTVELAELLVKDFNLGTVLCAVEVIKPNADTTPLVLSGKKLQLNRLSLAPEPYLRIYKKLPTGADALSLPGGFNAPLYCPVFRTRPLKRTRNPSWGVDSGAMTNDRTDDDINLPSELLVNVDGSPATLLVEAWDWQTNGKDRLIGRCTMPLADLKGGALSTGLQAPTLKDKQDLLDLVYTLIGCGIPSKVGSIQIKECNATRSSGARKLRASLHQDRAFDVDEQIRQLSEKEASDMIAWVPLAVRRAQFQNELRAGEETLQKSLSRGLGKWLVEMRRYLMLQFGTGLWRFYRRNDLFYQSQMTIGAEFGTATKALFVFSGSVITSNFLIWLMWFPAWIPQILSAAPGSLDAGDELFAVFSETSTAAIQATDLDGDGAIGLHELSVSFNNSDGTITSTSDPPKGILFFSGYMPETPLPGGAMYPTAVWYVLCGFFSLLITLMVYTFRLYEVIRHPGAAVSSSAALPQGTADVLNALFGGWDFTHYSPDATSKIRKELVTKIKEGEADAQRAAQSSAIVRTRHELQMLFLRRLVLMFIAFMLTAGGTGIIAACLVPNPFRDQVLVEFAETVPVIGPLANTLIITAVNALVPAIVKVGVVLEQWSPDVTIRQTLLRIFFVKMVNAIAIFLNLGLTTQADADFVDKQCVEKDAAATYVQLLISDFIVVSLSFSLPKVINQTWLPYLKWKYGPKKKEKIDPTAPPQTSSTDALLPKTAESIENGSAAPPAEPPAPTPSPSPPPPAAAPDGEPALPAAIALPRADGPASEAPPSPPPSPSSDAWGAWGSNAEEKGDIKKVPKDEEEDDDAFAGWREATRKPGNDKKKQQEEEAEEDEVGGPASPEKTKSAAQRYREVDPSYPLTGYEHPKAPVLELPKEVMELIYRQTLLFMGMMISPWLFLCGFVINFFIYWVKFNTVLYFHKRPKAIKDHFGAQNATRDFYSFFWLATLLAFPFYFIFISLPANPVCGPLRSQECASEFYQGNLTTCYFESVDGRVNYQDVKEALLPSRGGFDLGGLLAGNGTATDDGEPCDVACVFQTLFSYLVDVPVLAILVILLVTGVVFSNARANRLAFELSMARRELSIEYTDKKKVLRQLGVDI